METYKVIREFAFLGTAFFVGLITWLGSKGALANTDIVYAVPAAVAIAFYVISRGTWYCITCKKKSISQGASPNTTIRSDNSQVTTISYSSGEERVIYNMDFVGLNDSPDTVEACGGVTEREWG